MDLETANPKKINLETNSDEPLLGKLNQTTPITKTKIKVDYKIKGLEED